MADQSPVSFVLIALLWTYLLRVCRSVDEPVYYTIPEVCRLLRMGRTRLYGYLGTQIPVTRWGKLVRIHRDDLQRFMDAMREPLAPDSDSRG
jgi:excisionase family DNA binding protein